jgi:hypothetical protein
MLTQHRSHLFSTYTTILQHLAEIRQVVTAGKTPAGARVQPLPEPLRGKLLALLDSAAAGLEEAVKAFVPDFERATTEVGGVAATRMWASILLRTVEELVEDIHPKEMSRHYGEIGEGEAELLREKVEPVLATIRRGMKLLE